MLKRLPLLALFVGSITNIFAQGGTTKNVAEINTVTTAVPFVLIPPDARSSGMGDIGRAMNPDMNAIYHNPAAMAFVPGDYGVSISYTPWLRALVNDINMATLNGYYKIKKKQTIALGMRYFSLGNITFTDANANVIRDFRPYEMALDAHYSRALGKHLGVGVSLRFIYSNLASNITPSGGEAIKPGKAGSGDISFFYTTPIKLSKTIKSNFNAGLTFTNMGSKISYTNNAQNTDFIPANLGYGLGWNISINDHNDIAFYYDGNKLLVPTPSTVDQKGINGSNGPDGVPDYKQQSSVSGIFASFGGAPIKEKLAEVNQSFGVEYWYSKRVALRTGYFYESKSKGGRQFLTVGVGVKYSIFGLDFSYLVPTSSQKNPLDNTLRFSLLFDFNKAASATDPLFKKKNKGSTELSPK